MTKEKIKNLDWKLIAYFAALIFAVGSFYTMMQGKCEQIDKNEKISLSNEKNIIRIDERLKHIQEGIGRIETKLEN
jgi:hypothetical protein